MHIGVGIAMIKLLVKLVRKFTKRGEHKRLTAVFKSVKLILRQ